MGPHVSSQKSDQAIDSAVSSSTSFTTNFTNIATCNVSAYNSLTLQTGFYYDKDGTAHQCDFKGARSTIDVAQKVSSICALDSTAVSNNSSTVANDITNKILALATQQTKDSGGDFWSKLGINIDIQDSSVQEHLKTVISTAITNNFSNKCQSTIGVGNSATLGLCGDFTGARIAMNQALVASGGAKCVASLITDAFSQDKLINDAVAKTDQSQTTTGWIVYIVIAIIALAFIGLLIWIVRANAAKSGVNLTPRGAEQIGGPGTLPPPAPTVTEVASQAIAKVPA